MCVPPLDFFSSATVLAGKPGLTLRMLGASTAKVIGWKSLNGSYGALG